MLFTATEQSFDHWSSASQSHSASNQQPFDHWVSVIHTATGDFSLFKLANTWIWTRVSCSTKRRICYSTTELWLILPIRFCYTIDHRSNRHIPLKTMTVFLTSNSYAYSMVNCQCIKFRLPMEFKVKIKQLHGWHRKIKIQFIHHIHR